MMRALFSAISGLRNHMTFMDVIGNNIANVNTVGFKSSRVLFQDVLGQTIQGASAPTAASGGTNPMQVGLGMQLGSIDTLFAQGSLQSTGKLTDFAIQGDGFFIVNSGQRNLYARDGSFDVAINGDLVSPVTGFKVMGWKADALGNIDTSKPLEALSIPFGTHMAAQVTGNVALSGNVDASMAIAPTSQVSTTVNVYDSQGGLHSITLTFTKDTAVNSWTVTSSTTDPTITNGASLITAGSPVTFNASGQPDPPNQTLTLGIDYDPTLTGVTTPQPVTVDMSQLTQFAGPGQLTTASQDGFSAGTLITFSVGSGGDITGVFSNGATQKLGQLALALFANPAGLSKIGSNLYETSTNSGNPLVGTADTGGRGTVSTGVLESSNTDLAKEFTNIIIAERGFQANARVITASDEILQDLVNIRR